MTGNTLKTIGRIQRDGENTEYYGENMEGRALH